MPDRQGGNFTAALFVTSHDTVKLDKQTKLRENKTNLT